MKRPLRTTSLLSLKETLCAALSLAAALSTAAAARPLLAVSPTPVTDIKSSLSRSSLDCGSEIIIQGSIREVKNSLKLP